MWPVIAKLLDRLEHDDENPYHALDRWLLQAIGAAPPSTAHELAVSCRLRLGPGAKGPEIASETVSFWLQSATERSLVNAAVADDGQVRFSVTEAGEAHRRHLGRLGPGLAALLERVTSAPSLWRRAGQRIEQERAAGFRAPPHKRSGLPRITVSPGDADTSAEQASANLERVEHIVVLMMENRSFDHMMGYLESIDGQSEVNGPSRAAPIVYQGIPHRPGYLTDTALPKSMDPPHGRGPIAEQIDGGKMDGFIKSFAEHKDVPDPERVMGYYTHRELPVYDYFAHHFLMCDRWFSSVPSATWPNRLYSIAGTCEPQREGLFDDHQFLYDLASFVRLLADHEDERTWRWYSWDPGSLRLIDPRFRLDRDAEFHHRHFARVVQHAIEPGQRGSGGDTEIELGRGFLEDAANGDLPRVAWIDPNFVDLSILDPNSNDDHPPSDVRNGQELVMMVFRALAESPCWKNTMLVVTYDEHGGFYDHEPPVAPPEPDPQFATYGVRVPAFVVSPLVQPCTVSHTTFDHTTLIRTILERFGVDGAVQKMAETAPRVARAEHLGRLLTVDPGAQPRPPDYALVNAMLDTWRQQRSRRRSAASPEIAERSRASADWAPMPIVGFPAEYLTAARQLRADGLPAGHP